MADKEISDESNVINLFAAPRGPEGVTDAEKHSDEAEAELARYRSMGVGAVVMEYLGVRDNLDQERANWTCLEADLKAKLATMSMVLREKADVDGVDNFAIRGVGTAYRNKKVSYRVGDWESFIRWVDATKNFQCLEKRVAKLATAEIERAKGEVPPGIDKETEVEFLVRRNKA